MKSTPEKHNARKRILIVDDHPLLRDGLAKVLNQQADLTLDVVGAILDSRGMGWNDATRAIAYVRNRADVPVFAERCARRSIPAPPAVVFESVICRDDLLFELELDAAVAEHSA